MGAFNIMYIPSAIMVPRDATATARNIAGAELTYRIAILSGLVSCIAFIFLALRLYDLLKDVDRKQARLMVMLVAVSGTIGIVNLLNEVAPLILLSGADYLSVFTKPQLDALALGFLRLRTSGLAVNSAFWGLWLLPFGILAIKSGWIPKFIGVLLIVGCFAYLAGCFTFIIFPAQVPAVSKVTLPLAGAGELFMMLWLVFKGAKAPLPEARPSYAS
jgi:hypothetical protein